VLSSTSFTISFGLIGAPLIQRSTWYGDGAPGLLAINAAAFTREAPGRRQAVNRACLPWGAAQASKELSGKQLRPQPGRHQSAGGSRASISDSFLVHQSGRFSRNWLVANAASGFGFLPGACLRRWWGRLVTTSTKCYRTPASVITVAIPVEVAEASSTVAVSRTVSGPSHSINATLLVPVYLVDAPRPSSVKERPTGDRF